MPYEVTFDDILYPEGLKALDDATAEYIRRECHLEASGDDWREDLALDDELIGFGPDAHEDADGPVFDNEIAANNFAAYLSGVHIQATIIELA